MDFWSEQHVWDRRNTSRCLLPLYMCPSFLVIRLNRGKSVLIDYLAFHKVKFLQLIIVRFAYLLQWISFYLAANIRWRNWHSTIAVFPSNRTAPSTTLIRAKIAFFRLAIVEAAGILSCVCPLIPRFCIIMAANRVE